jgi:hypothetical protein
MNDLMKVDILPNHPQEPGHHNIKNTHRSTFNEYEYEYEKDDHDLNYGWRMMEWMGVCGHFFLGYGLD